jgi:hypothetical protein
MAAAAVPTIIDPDGDGWCLYNAILAAFDPYRASIKNGVPGDAGHEARAHTARKFAFLLAQWALQKQNIVDGITSRIQDVIIATGLPKQGVPIRERTRAPPHDEVVPPQFGYPTEQTAEPTDPLFVRMDSGEEKKYVTNGEEFLKGLYELNIDGNSIAGPKIWGEYTILRPLIVEFVNEFDAGLSIRKFDPSGNVPEGLIIQDPELTNIGPAPGRPIIKLLRNGNHFQLVEDTAINDNPIDFLEHAVFRPAGAASNPTTIRRVLQEARDYLIYSDPTYLIRFNPWSPPTASVGASSLHTAATGLVNLVGSIAHHIDPRPPIVKAAAGILGVVGATTSALGAVPSSSAAGASGASSSAVAGAVGSVSASGVAGASGGLPGAAPISGASSTTSSTLSAIADVARQHEEAARVVAEEARRQEAAARAAVDAATPGTPKAAAEAALKAAVARHEAADRNLTAATRNRIAAEAAVKAKKPAPLAALTAALRSRPAAPAIAAAALAGGPPPPGADPAVVAAATAAATQANNTPYVHLVAALRAVPERPPSSYIIPTEDALAIANLAAQVSNAPPQGISSGMRDLVARLTRLAQPSDATRFTDANASSMTDLVRKAYNNREIPTQADAARTVVVDALTTVAAAADLKETPGWAGSIVPTTNIKPSCVGAKFITPDCVAQGVQHSALVTNEIAQVPHSILNASTQAKYNADPFKGPATHAGDLTGDKLGRWIQLSHKYADRTIQIHNPETGHIEGYTVSNPYRAKSYRDRMLGAAAGAASFSNPTGAVPDVVQHDASGGDHPENVEMWQHNALLLNKIAPPEMIADTKTAVALLESLWFCGSSANLASDPRCFPARALGELREYQKTKSQQQYAALAKKSMNMSSWDRLKRSIGLFTDPFTDALPKPLRVAPPAASDTKEEEELGTPPPLPSSLKAFQEYAEKQASAQKQFRERIQTEIAALKADLARRGVAPPPTVRTPPAPTPAASPAAPARSLSATSSVGAVAGSSPASPAAAGEGSPMKPRIPLPGPRSHGVPDRFGSTPDRRSRVVAITQRVPAAAGAPPT